MWKSKSKKVTEEQFVKGAAMLDEGKSLYAVRKELGIRIETMRTWMKHREGNIRFLEAQKIESIAREAKIIADAAAIEAARAAETEKIRASREKEEKRRNEYQRDLLADAYAAKNEIKARAKESFHPYTISLGGKILSFYSEDRGTWVFSPNFDWGFMKEGLETDLIRAIENNLPPFGKKNNFDPCFPNYISWTEKMQIEGDLILHRDFKFVSIAKKEHHGLKNENVVRESDSHNQCIDSLEDIEC